MGMLKNIWSLVGRAIPASWLAKWASIKLALSGSKSAWLWRALDVGMWGTVLYDFFARENEPQAAADGAMKLILSKPVLIALHTEVADSEAVPVAFVNIGAQCLLSREDSVVGYGTALVIAAEYLRNNGPSELSYSKDELKVELKKIDLHGMTIPVGVNEEGEADVDTLIDAIDDSTPFFVLKNLDYIAFYFCQLAKEMSNSKIEENEKV